MKNKLMNAMLMSNVNARRGVMAIVFLSAAAMMTGCGADAAGIFDLILGNGGAAG